MKKHLPSLGIAAAALLLGGCFPTEHVWWSPDGQTAAVRSSEGLRLADAKGQLSGIVLPGAIQSAAWLRDGSGLVITRVYDVTNWTAAEKLIPPQEATATKELARAIPDLLKAGLTVSGGSWEKLDEKFLKPLGVTKSELLDPIWLCALSLYREQISAAIANFPNAASLEAELHSAETNGFPIHEITILYLRNGKPAREPWALERSLRPLLDPVLSPRHSLVAVQTADGGLKAMTLDGQDDVAVADEHVRSAAWSADGRTLIYITMAKPGIVGEIRSRTVANEEGDLLQGPAQAETLVIAAFPAESSPRLAVLPDGRVLFASLPIALPARAALIHPTAQFSLLEPTKPEVAPVPVKIIEGSLPDDLNHFAPSPDGRLVAVVEGGTDVVAILELATGKVKIISPAHDGWKSRLIPAWRNQLELTFAALPSATAKRPELILWQSDAPERVLSKKWPDEVVKPWLAAPGGSNDQPAK